MVERIPSCSSADKSGRGWQKFQHVAPTPDMFRTTGDVMPYLPLGCPSCAAQPYVDLQRCSHLILSLRGLLQAEVAYDLSRCLALSSILGPSM